ncbi:MAG: hypothetical protein LBP60_06100 [Spirochaetaceae bacterium]|jgi:hypothetical protein|nr:hypothetical protein [Spirochaetaceae bacterium]
MEIHINGKKANIVLESETNLGEVLTGIYTWLGNSGLFISGLEVDGTVYDSHSMERAFNLPLAGISAVNIATSGWAELMLEALVRLKQDLAAYTDPDKKTESRAWISSPAALFLEKNAPELYDVAVKTLEGSVSPADTLALVIERIREVENPGEEMRRAAAEAAEIVRRLEELPLDMQTGKDSRAAETITLFSPLAEKIYRLIFLFRQFGADIETIKVDLGTADSVNLESYINDFSAVLNEFTTAYENNDTVLVGDLAEYELAPRLLRLCSALCGIKTGKAAQTGEENQG